MGEDIQMSHRKFSICCEADGLNADEIFLGEEQKICIFKNYSMVLNLLENIEIGKEIWNCVGAISKDGSSYFRIGNRWFISNDCNEIFQFEVKEIEIAIYE